MQINLIQLDLIQFNFAKLIDDLPPPISENFIFLIVYNILIYISLYFKYNSVF